MYNFLIKPFVKNMDPDRASRVALTYFKILGMIPGGRLINRWVHNNRAEGLEREVMGLQFYNPLGLGAGLDTEGDLYNDLNDLGFSFSEIGPMGADGVRKAIASLQSDPQDDILGVCINKEFLNSFTLAYDFFDFFVIDFSTKLSTSILGPVLDARISQESYKPIVIKLPDNISGAELDVLTDFCRMNSIDCIQARSKEQVERIRTRSLGRLPIIANCHIKTPQEAAELLEAGADLIELRSGFAYEGPSLVNRILNYLQENAKNNNRRKNRKSA